MVECCLLRRAFARAGPASSAARQGCLHRRDLGAASGEARPALTASRANGGIVHVRAVHAPFIFSLRCSLTVTISKDGWAIAPRARTRNEQRMITKTYLLALGAVALLAGASPALAQQHGGGSGAPAPVEGSMAAFTAAAAGTAVASTAAGITVAVAASISAPRSSSERLTRITMTASIPTTIRTLIRTSPTSSSCRAFNPRQTSTGTTAVPHTPITLM